MLSFSIITCTWNSEPFLEKCMDSVRRQDYSAVEQIFVDGGSEDGTLARIKSASVPHQFVTNVRGGISNAMNVGIEMARGDIIAHLHGDDYFLQDDVLSRVANEMHRTGADWIFGRIATDLSGIVTKPTWKVPAVSIKSLQRGNFIGHPAVFVRKSLFERAGLFDTQLKYAMDYDLWFRLMRMSLPLFLDCYLTAFRTHSGSASTANSLAAFKEDHTVRRRYLGSGISEQCLHESIYIWRFIRHIYRLRR